MTPTTTERLPRGIVKSSNGRYTARLFRKGRMTRRCGLETVDAALDALKELEDAHGPPAPSRVPKFADWDKEFEEQKRKLPRGTLLTGIYKRAGGVMVSLTRMGKQVYVGHFNNLKQAVKARDAADRANPGSR